jgi:DNA glycosylase AlkZ-like
VVTARLLSIKEATSSSSVTVVRMMQIFEDRGITRTLVYARLEAVRSPLRLTRQQILAFRRRVGGLETRSPPGAASLRRAAWAGLQDSMPRAALLSLHARVAGVGPTTWDDPSLVQLWGPRYNTYVVAKRDFALFSLGRLPDDARGRLRAERTAEQVRTFLDGGRMTDREVAGALDIGNSIRYAAATGTIAIRWEGARAPVIWALAPPRIDAADARRALAHRYLHAFGPSTAGSFARWAGISRRAGADAFAAIEESLLPVRTPFGDALLLADDEASARATDPESTSVRLLPSGDAYFLLDGAERELLVPPAERRERLWTSRVWPGALLVDGEIRGTWRRADHVVRIDAWSRLSRARRDRIEAEAATLPLPGLRRAIEVVWDA